jgi:hypothetical protein
MMPGIIISFIFSKQEGLVLQTTPLQDEFACAEEPFDNSPNRFGVEIGTKNRPWSARNRLFALQQACFYQPFDRAVANSANSSGLVQADYFGIW